MVIDELLSHFKGVVANGRNRWKVLCPCHQDGKPSLAIACGTNGRIVLHCHAGCDVETILDSVSLHFEDLFGSGQTQGIKSRKQVMSPETAKIRNAVYLSLLASCDLSIKHRAELTVRGFSDAAIGEIGYKSLSLLTAVDAVRTLKKYFSVDNLLAVPGFIKDATGSIRLIRDNGLMIPVRNTQGQIIAIQLRTEDEDGKYKWFSASENTVGSPCHMPLVVSIKASSGGCEQVRITEGPLKADLACYLDRQVLTIGFAGTSNWRAALEALAELQPLQVRLAFDSDWRRNPAVKLSLNECFRTLIQEGYETVVEVWDEKYKGIDDLLHAGGHPSVVGEEEIRPSLEEEFPEHEGILLLQASRLSEKPIEWFWNQWLPYGSFCTLDGDPNEGKSTIVSALSAHATGGPLLPGTPDSLGLQVYRDVLLIACEDDKNNTWLPRLRVAGGDLKRIHFWDGNQDEKSRRWLPNLPADMRRLEYLIKKLEVGLVVIDPLYSFIDSKFDSWKDQHMKLVLNELTDLASRTGACILGIRHLNKSATLPSLYRGLGSIGVIGVARSGLVVVRDADEEEIRYLCQVKNNLAKPQAPYKFRIDSDGKGSRVVWMEQMDCSLRDLSQGSSGGGKGDGKTSQAAQFLIYWLSREDVPACEIYKHAEKMGIAKRTLDNAKKTLGIRSYQENSMWYWSVKDGQPK